MPNWVFNGLTIEGNPDSVKALMEQMNQPFKMVHDSWNMETHQQEKKLVTYPNPIFAFWNIVKPTDMEAYMAQPAKWEGGPISFEGDDWYNWNIRNWGTKWDVAVHADDKYPDTNMEEAENGENYVVHYNFNTAWSRPLPALENLSAQYPTLLFTLSYEEETGWGGEMEFLRGKVLSYSEYDNMCSACDATDQMEYCENDCGEVCASCNYISGEDEDAMKECQTHMVLLESREKAEV